MIYATKEGFKIITSIGCDSLELFELKDRYEIIGDDTALKAIKVWLESQGVTILCCIGRVEVLYIPKGTRAFKLVRNIADLA